MQEIIRNMWRDDEGQDLVEYALIAGLVAMAAVAAISTAGTQVNTIWTNIKNQLTTAAGNGA